jgi:hypothetical protein
MLEGAPCVAARRQSLRVVLRGPVTHGRASNIAAFTNCRIVKLKAPLMRGFFRAQDKIRTCTTFRSLPPQSSASTSFATWATRGCKCRDFSKISASIRKYIPLCQPVFSPGYNRIRYARGLAHYRHTSRSGNSYRHSEPPSSATLFLPHHDQK